MYWLFTLAYNLFAQNSVSDDFESCLLHQLEIHYFVNYYSSHLKGFNTQV